MEKSLNQRYKESGTTLSYKEWRIREDEKMSSFDGIKAPFESIKDSLSFQKTKELMAQQGGFKKEESGKTTLGIKKTILIGAGVIIILAIGYKIYKSTKK